MRVEHRGDYLSIVIYKNGEPWLSYPDCFGQGDPFEGVFAFEEGLRQGWSWQGMEHASWVERCGASPFDEDAHYTVIGFGLTEVPASNTEFSELVPLSEPISLELIE